LENQLLLLASSFVVSGLESISCYFITNNIIGSNVKNAFKAFSFRDMFLLGVHIVFSIAVLIFVSSSHFQALDNAWRGVIFGTLWAITAVILVTVVFRILKSKNYLTTIEEVVLIFLICFVFNKLIGTVAITPIIVSIDILDFQFNRFPILVFLWVSSVIFTILFLWSINKIDMNKLFIFVIHRLAVKLAIFMITLVSLLVIFSVIFYYARLEDILTFHILIPIFSISVVSLLIGFAFTLKAAHQYEVVVPEKYHEMKRILTLLNLKAEDAQNVDDLKEMIGSTIELMEIKTIKPTTSSENDPQDFEAFINSAINSLKLNHESDVEVKTSIKYFEPHKNVCAMTISYMLGTLLENAIETGTEHPIVVDILTTEHVLFIKVANEAESKSPQELYSMLSKGYSTKEKVGRGFGLAKLKKLVENHQGNIIITQEINPTVQTNYITFTLNF